MFKILYIILFLLPSCTTNQEKIKKSIFNQIKDKVDTNIEYYSNGNIKFEIQRFNNKLDGCSKYWSKSGYLINQVCYENDILHGEWKEYHSNGKTKYVVSYSHGLKDSFEIWYHENGIMKSKTLFKNGKKDSKTIRWDRNGNLVY